MTSHLILCGMYAFSPALRDVWQQVFMPLCQSLSLPTSGTLDIRYSSTATDFQNSSLYLGHACEYSLWNDFLKTHEAITVPEFAIDGCSGIHYSG